MDWGTGGIGGGVVLGEGWYLGRGGNGGGGIGPCLRLSESF